MSKLIPVIIEVQKIIQLSPLTIDQANDLRSQKPESRSRKIVYQGLEIYRMPFV